MKKHPTANIQHPAAQHPASEVWEFNEDSMNDRKFDLEERLLESAPAVIDLSEPMPATRAGNHVAGQILRPGTSPFPNPREAEDAESREDFVHKFKICLKELRDSRRWARLIKRKGRVKENVALIFILGDSEELFRTFSSSVWTAKKIALAERCSPTGKAV
jgi:four helix bundle protein